MIENIAMVVLSVPYVCYPMMLQCKFGSTLCSCEHAHSCCTMYNATDATQMPENIAMVVLSVPHVCYHMILKHAPHWLKGVG